MVHGNPIAARVDCGDDWKANINRRQALVYEPALRAKRFGNSTVTAVVKADLRV